MAKDNVAEFTMSVKHNKYKTMNGILWLVVLALVATDVF